MLDISDGAWIPFWAWISNRTRCKSSQHDAPQVLRCSLLLQPPLLSSYSKTAWVSHSKTKLALLKLLKKALQRFQPHSFVRQSPNFRAKYHTSKLKKWNQLQSKQTIKTMHLLATCGPLVASALCRPTLLPSCRPTVSKFVISRFCGKHALEATKLFIGRESQLTDRSAAFWNWPEYSLRSNFFSLICVFALSFDLGIDVTL